MLALAALIAKESAVHAVLGRIGRQREDGVQISQHGRAIFTSPGDAAQVMQHAYENGPFRHGLEIVVVQRATRGRLNHGACLLVRHRFARFVDIDQKLLSVSGDVLDDEMSWQTDTRDTETDFARQLDVDQRQRNGQAFAIVEHFVHITVRAVVVVGATAMKAVILEQELVKRLQLLGVACSGRSLGLQFGGQSAELVAIDVDVELVSVQLGDQESRMEQVDIGILFGGKSLGQLGKHSRFVHGQCQFAQLGRLLFQALGQLAQRKHVGVGLGREPLDELCVERAGRRHVGDEPAEILNEFSGRLLRLLLFGRTVLLELRLRRAEFG